MITKDGRATGVALADGTEYHATTVVSALDPRRTFLELVDPRELPTDLVETITRFRFQGTSAKVNFALDGLPQLPGAWRPGDQYRGFINIGPSMDYIERAFDEAKYGWYSPRPYIDCAIQSTIDPDMAPPGKHVMCCFIAVHAVPAARERLGRRAAEPGRHRAATLESFFPGFSDLVLHREVVTPLDIERTVGLSEGNIFAGEFLAPQMYFFRPAPGWSQYRTPIDGYYQCGSGTHPGGCVMGAPGKLAAQRILKDRAKSRGVVGRAGPATNRALHRTRNLALARRRSDAVRRNSKAPARRGEAFARRRRHTISSTTTLAVPWRRVDRGPADARRAGEAGRS